MFNLTAKTCATLARISTFIGSAAGASVSFVCSDVDDFDLRQELRSTAIGEAVVVGIAMLATGAIYLIKKCTKSDPEPELSAAEAKSFAELKKDPQVKSVEAVVDGKEKTLQ